MEKRDMYVRRFADSVELCEKGYRVKSIGYDRFDSNKFVIWFYNEGDLEKEIEIIKERSRKAWEERQADLSTK